MTSNVIDLKSVLNKLTPVAQKELTYVEMNARMDELRAEVHINTDLSQMYLNRALECEKEYDKLSADILKSAIEEL